VGERSVSAENTDGSIDCDEEDVTKAYLLPDMLVGAFPLFKHKAAFIGTAPNTIFCQHVGSASAGVLPLSPCLFHQLRKNARLAFSF